MLLSENVGGVVLIQSTVLKGAIYSTAGDQP
jgi:hypothetical protein